MMISLWATIIKNYWEVDVQFGITENVCGYTDYTGQKRESMMVERLIQLLLIWHPHQEMEADSQKPLQHCMACRGCFHWPTGKIEQGVATWVFWSRNSHCSSYRIRGRVEGGTVKRWLPHPPSGNFFFRVVWRRAIKSSHEPPTVCQLEDGGNTC